MSASLAKSHQQFEQLVFVLGPAFGHANSSVLLALLAIFDEWPVGQATKGP